MDQHKSYTHTVLDTYTCSSELLEHTLHMESGRREAQKATKPCEAANFFVAAGTEGPPDDLTEAQHSTLSGSHTVSPQNQG